MKKYLALPGLILFSILVGFTACKKDNPSNTKDDDPEVKVHSVDENFFTTENDAVLYEANLLLEAVGAVSPRIQENIICDATISYDLESDPRTITATFNGADCIGNRKREGVITLSAPLGMKWRDQGSNIKIVFKDFKITRKNSNQSLTINGEQTYTNTSGGLLLNLANVESITHSVTSDGLSVTFSNGAKCTWRVAQQRVFTYDNGAVVAVSGTHTEGNNNQVVFWGTTRFGHDFVSSITDPLVIRQDCGFRLTSGAIKHEVADVTATATFGLDASGNPVSCPTGSYYCKLTWADDAGNNLVASFAY